MSVVAMSLGELSRLGTLKRVQRGELRVEDAATLLGLKRRQVFRLLKRMRLEGASGLVSRIHEITADYIVGKPSFGDLHDVVHGHLVGQITVAHSYFDKGALTAACRVHDHTPIDATWLDSVRVAKRAWPDLASHRLNVVCEHFGIRLKHHDALSDARAAGLIVLRDRGDRYSARRLAHDDARPRSTSPTPRAVRTARRPACSAAWRAPAWGPRIPDRRAGRPGGAAVGKTTTMLVVVADEPFGYVRYDAQFRRARELRDAGSALEILSAATLNERLTVF